MGLILVSCPKQPFIFQPKNNYLFTCCLKFFLVFFSEGQYLTWAPRDMTLPMCNSF